MITMNNILNPQFGEAYRAEDIRDGSAYIIRPLWCYECGSFEREYRVTLIGNQGIPDYRYSMYVPIGEIDIAFPEGDFVFCKADYEGRPII